MERNEEYYVRRREIEEEMLQKLRILDRERELEAMRQEARHTDKMTATLGVMQGKMADLQQIGEEERADLFEEIVAAGMHRPSSKRTQTFGAAPKVAEECGGHERGVLGHGSVGRAADGRERRF